MSGNSQVAILVGIALAALVVALVRPVATIFLVVLFRAFSDVGAASTGSLIPSSLVSAALAILAIVAACAPGQARLPAQLRTKMVQLTAIATVWTVIAIGSGVEPLTAAREYVRWLSILAVCVTAWRAGARLSQTAQRRAIHVLALVPATALLIGYAANIPQMVQTSGRPSGTFSHANAAGAYLGIAVLASVYAYSRWHARASVVSALVASGALVATASMGAVVATAVGLLLFFVHTSRIRAFSKLLAMAFATAAALALVLNSNIAARFEEIENSDISDALASGTSGNSLEWRFINWHFFIDEWSRSPWLGHGLGAADAYAPLGAPAHSLYVEALFNLGIVGVALIALVLLGALRTIRAKAPHALSFVLCVGIFVMVNGTVSNILGYTAAQYLAAFAISMALASETRPSEIFKPRRHHYSSLRRTNA